MAENSYPKIGTKAWTALRVKAASAPSTKFTPEVVASLLGMSSPTSALKNTVRPMRQRGLLDEDGALTELGNKWRVDASYSEACEQILNETYPEALSAFIDDDGKPDAVAVRTWFDHQGFGDSNARQMSVTYVLVASKKPPEAPTGDSGKPAKKAPPKKTPAAKAQEPGEAGEAQEITGGGQPPAKPSDGPTLHLDIQIHIPADATPEQIDSIFSSMARHLYAK